MPANVELVQEAVAAKLDEKLPDEWKNKVHKRRDFSVLPTDEFPATYVVKMPERILEIETDNQVLVGYPVGVAFMVKKPAITATVDPLPPLRRIGQQALHTTDYAGLSVEEILLEEGLDAALPGEDEGFLVTGFTIVIGLLEPREA